VNFFEAQDRARRATRWLVIVYIVATLLIVAGVTLVVAAAFYMLESPGLGPSPAVLLATAVLATLLIVGSTLYRTAALSVGGSRVATDMGGTPVPPDVQDPLRRRLRNIVEEMSIASGVPVPDIYVLEAEDGINAFAAGFAPGDAAVAVTRGALDVLNRDELQGVIAHEFSHILNGDMRINIRMIGVLFGIMVLSIIGRIVVRGGYHGGASYSRRNRGAPAVMAVGVGLVVLGWIGVFFARLIKAAVSRQRESLADASAVQFTRQSQGLANALKKIGGYSGKSYLSAADPEEISHMLFARGSRRYMALFATHPPLTERIQALDPSFREEDLPRILPHPQRGHQDVEAQALADRAALASAAASGGEQAEIADSRMISATVGNPDARHIGFARRLRRSIPENLYSAAHSEASAFLLTLALVLDRTGRHVERQLHLVTERLGSERTSAVRRYYEQLMGAGPAYGLPLLEIAFPALKRRPQPQLRFLVDLIRRLVETDGEIDLFEYCFYQVLVGNLHLHGDPGYPVPGGGLSKREARAAALQLMRIVADKGHDDPGGRDAAWRAGAAELGEWASGSAAHVPASSGTVAELDRALQVLRRINGAARERLIQALSVTIGHDNRMTVIEAELMRAICASLNCPLPPLLTADRIGTAEPGSVSGRPAAADAPK
jgi:Zn-dependent protease with chaperone function